MGRPWPPHPTLDPPCTGRECIHPFSEMAVKSEAGRVEGTGTVTHVKQRGPQTKIDHLFNWIIVNYSILMSKLL